MHRCMVYVMSVTCCQGLHFVHTTSVALPAAGLLPASKSFVSQNTREGGRRKRLVSFSTLYNLIKTMHPTLTEWLTIETGARRI